jgi:hypothetical protein
MAQILKAPFYKGITTILETKVSQIASVDFQIWITKELEEEITSKEREIFRLPVIILGTLVVAKCLF